MERKDFLGHLFAFFSKYDCFLRKFILTTNKDHKSQHATINSTRNRNKNKSSPNIAHFRQHFIETHEKKLNKTFLQKPEALPESDEQKGREGGGGDHRKGREGGGGDHRKGREGGGGDHRRGADRSRTVELLIGAEQKEKRRRAEREKKKP